MSPKIFLLQVSKESIYFEVALAKFWRRLLGNVINTLMIQIPIEMTREGILATSSYVPATPPILALYNRNSCWCYILSAGMCLACFLSPTRTYSTTTPADNGYYAPAILPLLYMYVRALKNPLLLFIRTGSSHYYNDKGERDRENFFSFLPFFTPNV